ncbi:NACHT, LRR and PYD domains-containing protein 12-like [Erythrolamprus reginae]|uniref:NACHT, LRR and PYD domains-containing protein 12-like n=1 Tax=Erythrolamprus reginae TaxID=121349 RepID=UPI00396C5137
MSNTIKEDIYNALNELTEKQFKEFKWWLNTINYDGRPKIPKASLGKADLQHEVVDLLIQHYGEDALEICTDVLRKCNRNDLAKNLEETKDVDAHQLPISSEYRNYIKKKYAMIKDPNAIPGEYLPLNQRYSKLIILDNHQSEEEKEDEILAMGRKHLEIISKRAEISTSIETLFNPDKYGLTPQIVVLQGAAGIGKTMMAKKIIFDWASQQLYQNKFNYVFYISCSEMNFHAESQKTSIAEIISNEWLKCQKVKNVIENILRNEEKLLFIIDGFDELRHSFNQAENYCCIDPWKKEPVRIILSNLFQKRILPKSSLIITTRPTALEKLYQCLEHPRCFEILGFSTKEREEYFYTFFEKKDQATQALRFVKQNDTLFTMCVIPLVSWIICTVMKQELERGKDLQKTPYTLTAIYMLYLSSLLKFHHKESKQDVQANVKGLSSLAAEGVSKRKIFFMEKEVKKHGLDQKDIPLFLNQSVFKRDIDCIETYSFIHLSFQEFFAALFYVLEEGDEQHSKKWGKNLQTLLETHRSFRSDFVVGFHFLFGLLNEEKRMRELRKEFGWEISPKNKEFLLNWVKNNIPKRRHNFQLQKEMFSYLYETRDDNFIKNAVCSITEIDYQSNSDMELMILAYCIQHCQNLKYLFAKGSAFLSHAETELHLPEDKEWNLDERYMEDFFKALTKLRNLRELRLNGWSFTESCSRQLAEVFKKNQRLKMLHLAPKDIDDRAAELLCEGLQHVDCKVETLVLSGEILIESCSRHLAEVLRKNQRLRELTLYLKNPDDKIMEVLCDGLKQPECTIETLKLTEGIITKSGSRHLAEVIRKKQRLKLLYLYLNKEDNEAVELLCEGLKHPECTVKTLELAGEILTESCSRNLAEVLRKKQSLRELTLFLKNTDDKIMEVLCDGLKQPECTIGTLKLAGEILTESCSRNLAEVLRKNQSLRELTLLLNNLDDKIMELLCDGLKNPECTIETLKLAGEILTESCSRNLAEVLRKNQRLRQLTLFLNNLDDKIMEVLCDGLKKPECTIETLKLTEGVITKSGSRHLAEVIRKKQRLKTLYLKVNNDDNEAMEVLCEGLKHPECTVKTLELAGEILTESCSRNLAEVLRKNQRLTELTLFLNNLDDKIMEVLCDGLKNPECTIETLKLTEKVITKSGSRHLAEVIRKKQRLKTLYLKVNNDDNEAMEVLCEGLKHPECTVQTLQLAGEILTESCSRNLAEVLRKNQRLRELTLFLNNLDDKIMEVLCDGLKKPECTIETLNLTEGVITKSGSRHLAEVIRKKQRLKTLYLKVNNDDNEAMEVLCEGLKHPECTVKTLELAGEILTESCSRNLAEVLRKNQRLRELTLLLNNLDDKIMEVLCDGLKKPECTIETLKLAGEILTESCSRNLAEVLRKNQSLRQLTLFLNNLDDKIMEVLCDGLKNPECTIETLNLTEGVITKSGSRHLAEVIRKKQRLKTLYLNVNNDDNEAMEVLCEGLKHPECTVQTLELAGEILTESCSRNLAEVLRKNQRLRELTLFLNNLDDKIMEVLCDGLKKPECTIETLKLTEGVITKSGSRHLAEVIRKKQRLKTLYLNVNNDDNEAMEVLCEGLKHPECTVKTLELAGEILTESCSRNLAEVLRKNQSLRELTLLLNNLDDKIMEVLCDGLKKPECTIETLKLDGEILTESCSRNLAEVLRKNQSLRQLTLFLNNLDDKIMEVLCDGLKKPECTIGTLKLNGKIYCMIRKTDGHESHC